MANKLSIVIPGEVRERLDNLSLGNLFGNESCSTIRIRWPSLLNNLSIAICEGSEERLDLMVRQLIWQ